MKRRKDIKWGSTIESEALFPTWKKELEKDLSIIVNEDRVREGFHFPQESIQLEQ